MKTSEQIDQILPALAIVKANLTGVKKGTKNTFFKSSYADLNTHLEAVEPLLEENGLVLLQPTNNLPEGNVVSSRIYHVKSGQFVEASMKLIGENDMQKAGSAVTYARRYTLGSLLSMQAVDDDGEGAIGRKTETKSVKSSEVKPITQTTESALQTPPTNRPSFRDRVKTKTEPTKTVSTSQDDI